MDSTSLVFHFDISGREIKDVQSQNVLSIVVTLFVFHFEISGKVVKLKHP